MLSRFFIHRPIFATVLSIVVITMGLTSLVKLLIAQYPDLALPTIAVQELPGCQLGRRRRDGGGADRAGGQRGRGMLYMSSISASRQLHADDHLRAGHRPRHRVGPGPEPRVVRRAEAEDVRRLGIDQEEDADFKQMISVFSPDGSKDEVFLSNWSSLNLRDELKRISGVGDAQIFGAADYSMRLWLDPLELEARSLTPGDVLGALQEQNVQVAAGKIGEDPAPAGTAFEYTVSTEGRLTSPDEFERIVVRTGEDGRVLRVGDIARVERGAQNYVLGSALDGRPAATIAVYQLPGANLIDISKRVAALLEGKADEYPDGLSAQVTYDAANVVNASIKEIISTLLIAAFLVIVTVLIFLQDLRATIISTVTIPVSLIGTFAVMSALGFSLNTLSLFGIVLAIGIVVDDAIVVVENVARNIDAGLPPREAAVKAMEEVTGPVIATTWCCSRSSCRPRSCPVSWASCTSSSD